MNGELIQVNDLAIKMYFSEYVMYAQFFKYFHPENKLSKRIQVYHHPTFYDRTPHRHLYVPIELDKFHFVDRTFNLDDGWFPLVVSSFSEICIEDLCKKDNFDETAAKLVNLEQISIEKITLRRIEALVSYTPKLKTILYEWHLRVTIVCQRSNLNLNRCSQRIKMLSAYSLHRKM